MMVILNARLRNAPGMKSQGDKAYASAVPPMVTPMKMPIPPSVNRPSASESGPEPLGDGGKSGGAIGLDQVWETLVPLPGEREA